MTAGVVGNQLCGFYVFFPERYMVCEIRGRLRSELPDRLLMSLKHCSRGAALLMMAGVTWLVICCGSPVGYYERIGFGARVQNRDEDGARNGGGDADANGSGDGNRFRDHMIVCVTNVVECQNKMDGFSNG
jgi:hypothetical protein